MRLLAVGLLALLVAAAVWATVLIFGWHTSSGDLDNEGSSETSETSITILDAEAVDYSYTPDTSDALNLPAAEDGVEAFSLTKASTPNIDDTQLERINQAIAQIESLGDLSFVLLNLDTGQGIAYHTDTSVYGASSFKAMYAVYLCQYLIENGELSLDDWCLASGSYSSDSSGGSTDSSDNSSAEHYQVSELIEAAIVNSDNNSYIYLRNAYDDMGLEEWLTSISATEIAVSTWNYPTYCARTSVALWLNAYNYFQSNTELAQWLRELCGSTVTSFLRSGINDTTATVYNKAGWYPDDGTAYSATVDAGIVVDAEGNTYLISIMTSMSYSDSSVAAYQELASALYEIRSLFNG